MTALTSVISMFRLNSGYLLLLDADLGRVMCFKPRKSDASHKQRTRLTLVRRLQPGVCTGCTSSWNQNSQ